VESRFYRWQRVGIWQRPLEALQQQADAAQELNWNMHHVDSSVVYAHQHAAGAKESCPEAEALGRSHGGFSTKTHLRLKESGKQMTICLTPGQYHEATEARTFDGAFGQSKRPGPGRPKLRP
jgi:hypothetical protein